MDDVGDRGVAPYGFHWAWVPDAETTHGLDWQVISPEDARPCRFTTAHHQTCKRASVARLKRKTQWWHYCEQHLYGRRIRNQVVEVCILLPDKPEEQRYA